MAARLGQVGHSTVARRALAGHSPHMAGKLVQVGHSYHMGATASQYTAEALRCHMGAKVFLYTLAELHRTDWTECQDMVMMSHHSQAEAAPLVADNRIGRNPAGYSSAHRTMD
jgi:hypothetical protein